MTLEAWVRPSALGASAWRCLLFKEQTGNMVYSLYAHQGAAPLAQVFVGSTERNVVGTSALALNAWSHLAATYDGSSLRLYVNGVLVQSLAVSGAIPTSTGVLHLGGNAVWGERFAGLLDDVRIYNRALSGTQIQTDMNTAVP
jgi:hypothetical protein